MVRINSNYTTSIIDSYIYCYGSPSYTVTLPDATKMNSKTFYIYKTDKANAIITVATSNGQTIDGVSSVQLTSQNAYCIATSNGANWVRTLGSGAWRAQYQGDGQNVNQQLPKVGTV